MKTAIHYALVRRGDLFTWEVAEVLSVEHGSVAKKPYRYHVRIGTHRHKITPFDYRGPFQTSEQASDILSELKETLKRQVGEHHEALALVHQPQKAMRQGLKIQNQLSPMLMNEINSRHVRELNDKIEELKNVETE